MWMGGVPVAISPGGKAKILQADGNWAAPLPTGTIYFEKFPGTGNLSTHRPQVGTAYVVEIGGDDLTLAVLDGTGGLPTWTEPNPPLLSEVLAPAAFGAAKSYNIKCNFTISARVSGSPQIDLSGIDLVSDNYLVEIFIKVLAGAWVYDASVINSSGAVLYDSGNTNCDALMTAGNHSLEIDVRPDGTAFKFDGVVIKSTAFVPDIAPTHVGIQMRAFTTPAAGNRFTQVSAETCC